MLVRVIETIVVTVVDLLYVAVEDSDLLVLIDTLEVWLSELDTLALMLATSEPDGLELGEPVLVTLALLDWLRLALPDAEFDEDIVSDALEIKKLRVCE